MSHLLLAAAPEPQVAPAVPPAHTVVVAALGVAIVLVLVFWELAGHATVIAHEGAHALTTMALGGTVHRVVINEDHTGETTVPRDGPTVLPLMAGYYGPPLFGLLGAALLVKGAATALLWIIFFLLAVMLIVVGSIFTLLIVVGLGAFLYLTATYGSASAQVIVACTLVWLLLVGGVVDAFDHFWHGDDYGKLAEYTGVVPRFVWACLGIVVAGVCLVAGGSWLLGLRQL